MNVVTVSQLNKQVKNYLEYELGCVHVEGEVSNLSRPSSGHFYFTLKDATAQICAVFFKNRHTKDQIATLRDGQKVVATGTLSLYEARGNYQLIVEKLTDSGFGALYQLFEELKIKLAAQGLFDPLKKKKLPAFPLTIGIITSTTGAALQDMLSTLARRFPQANLLIYASEVQGVRAPQQLVAALKQAQGDRRAEVLILARGGGSIEDLWAFNDEQLAWEISRSTIPIISGVGHETDFTIADFVADYRAETPTAAAVAATPDRMELLNKVDAAILQLFKIISHREERLRIKLIHLMDKLTSPQKTIASHWQKLDYLEKQLCTYFSKLLAKKTHQLEYSVARLKGFHPKTQITQNQKALSQLHIDLVQHMQQHIRALKNQFNALRSTLQAVSPLATLDRGYAIVTKNKSVVYDSAQVTPGDAIEVHLAKGGLVSEVIKVVDE